MISRIDVPRGTPYIVPGKSSGSWTAQSSSCRSGEKSCAGSPAAIQPIGTTVPGGSARLTCKTLLIAQLNRVPAREPGEHRDPGRYEHLVLDDRAVEVTVRSDQHGVPDNQLVLCSSSKHGVLHDEHVLAELDRPAVAVDHRPVRGRAAGTDGSRRR